ncbi:MAG: WD40/YVTN/BNR-like repeat-containing protein [Anaerolineales bacterium]
MNAKTFLATTGAGLARASRDAEGNWSVEFLLAEQDVRCLAADPLSQHVVYAGTQGGGVLRSDDRGKTWRPAGLAGRMVKALAASKVEPGLVYAGMKPPLLFVSRDGGTSWRELELFRRRRAFWWFSPAEGSPYTPFVQGIALSPADPNVIVAGIELGAVLRSADGGETWAGHRPGALRDCHSLTAHATNGDWMYEGGGTGAGAAFSREGGKTWRQPKPGLDRHYGWAVAADPARPEVWYVSLSPGAFKAHSENDAQAYIFRAEGDAPWQQLSGGLPQPLNHMPYALLTDPAAPGHVYAGLSNGDVWHSTDYGDSWAQLPFNLKAIQRTLIML